jgi:hypothetical protein
MLLGLPLVLFLTGEPTSVFYLISLFVSLCLNPLCSLKIFFAYSSIYAYSLLSEGNSFLYLCIVAASCSFFSFSIALFCSAFSSGVSLTNLRIALFSSKFLFLSILARFVYMFTLSKRRVSLMRFFLIDLSSGVSIAKLGVWLTSSNNGSRF